MKRSFIVAAVLIAVGITLRLSAPLLVQVETLTEYEVAMEAACDDVGMGCFYLGGVILVGVLLIPSITNTEKKSPNPTS